MLYGLKRQETTGGSQGLTIHSSSRLTGMTQEPIRHSDFWFDDGSIVLRSEKPVTLFRVHRALIARHSEVFRHMLSIPQPPNDDSTDVIESCPVVDLHDVSDDVASLLRAIYDGPNWGDNGMEDFKVVSGILRLSHKYMLDSLRLKAIEHLQRAWPTTLEGWDAREELARFYDGQQGPQGGRFPHPARVIQLARSVNAYSLLPSAFYDMSRSSFTVIFELSPLLPLHDTQSLAVGKESSQIAVTSLIRNLGNGRCTSKVGLPLVGSMGNGSSSGNPGRTMMSCHSPVSCRKDFSELVDLATQHYLFDRERGYMDPLYVAEELGQLKSPEFSDCKACAYALENWSVKERERIWRSIPSWFRLPGWESCL